MSGAEAAAQVQLVIDGRKSIVSELDRLIATTNGTGRLLVTSLRRAIDLSLESDYDYQRWMANNSATDATDPCQRAQDANSRSFESIAERASLAKEAFLSEYITLARGLGFNADWKFYDF